MSSLSTFIFQRDLAQQNIPFTIEDAAHLQDKLLFIKGGKYADFPEFKGWQGRTKDKGKLDTDPGNFQERRWDEDERKWGEWQDADLNDPRFYAPMSDQERALQQRETIRVFNEKTKTWEDRVLGGSGYRPMKIAKVANVKLRFGTENGAPRMAVIQLYDKELKRAVPAQLSEISCNLSFAVYRKIQGILDGLSSVLHDPTLLDNVYFILRGKTQGGKMRYEAEVIKEGEAQKLFDAVNAHYAAPPANDPLTFTPDDINF